MFCIEIAGLSIGIHPRFLYLRAQCDAYLTRQPPRFTVRASNEALFREAAADRRYPPPDPPDRFGPERPWGYYESLCVCRAICRRLPFYDAFLIHAAAIEADGRAYLFAAPSGTGKTTHARLWQEQLGERVHFINGDKPVLRLLDGRFFACGTPWNGKERLGANLLCPVGGICFLERAAENRIRRLAPAELPGRLFHQLVLPQEPQAFDRFWTVLDRAARTLPFYLLQCNREPEAALLAYHTMREG